MQKLSILLIAVLFTLCNFFKPDVNPTAIARVGDDFLYKEDLENLVPTGTSPEDSLVLVNNYIDQWAQQKLLLSVAERNISDNKKYDFDQLIEKYKNDLYVNEYIEQIVKTTVDTIVSEDELKKYYDLNKENFKTNSTLLQLRFINLPKDHPKFTLIKGKFLDFRKSDKKFWDTYQLQFKKSALNDSVWVEMNEVYRTLPFINPDNRDKFINEGIAFEQPDSTNVYLVKIKKIINRNQIGPFEYLKPTLRQVILNRRKLELIKKFEKEITDDAIKNKQYEVYK